MNWHYAGTGIQTRLKIAGLVSNSGLGVRLALVPPNCRVGETGETHGTQNSARRYIVGSNPTRGTTLLMSHVVRVASP